MPESGRGRGLTSTDTTTTVPTTITAPATTTGSNSPPSKSSSEESPPQQHSPPHSQSSGSASVTTQSLGRAALRGAPHQPVPTARTDILAPFERLQLQDTGDVSANRPERTEMRIESVLYTKPATCTETKVPQVRKWRYFVIILK